MDGLDLRAARDGCWLLMRQAGRIVPKYAIEWSEPVNVDNAVEAHVSRLRKTLDENRPVYSSRRSGH